MIEKLKIIEKIILLDLLKNESIWEDVDIRIPNPRTYLLSTKIEDCFLTLSKIFYCNESDLKFKNNNEDIVVHFLDGFWQLNDNGVKYAEKNTKESYFIIQKNNNYIIRNTKKKDWVYFIILSKTKPIYNGVNLKPEIKTSLLKSIQILLS